MTTDFYPTATNSNLPSWETAACPQSSFHSLVSNMTWTSGEKFHQLASQGSDHVVVRDIKLCQSIDSFSRFPSVKISTVCPQHRPAAPNSRNYVSFLSHALGSCAVFWQHSWRSRGLAWLSIRALARLRARVFVHMCSGLLAQDLCALAFCVCRCLARLWLAFCVSERAAMPCWCQAGGASR